MLEKILAQHAGNYYLQQILNQPKVYAKYLRWISPDGTRSKEIQGLHEADGKVKWAAQRRYQYISVLYHAGAIERHGQGKSTIWVRLWPDELINEIEAHPPTPISLSPAIHRALVFLAKYPGAYSSNKFLEIGPDGKPCVDGRFVARLEKHGFVDVEISQGRVKYRLSEVGKEALS